MEPSISNPYESAYDAAVRPKSHKRAVAAFIFGILSVVFFGCGINLLFSLAAIVLGVLSFTRKESNKAFAVVGIVLAFLGVFISVTLLFAVKDFIVHGKTFLTDYQQLYAEQDTVFPAYEESQELPYYLEKYTDTPYSEMFWKYGFDIYDIMDKLLSAYQKEQLPEITVSSEAITLPTYLYEIPNNCI